MFFFKHLSQHGTTGFDYHVKGTSKFLYLCIFSRIIRAGRGYIASLSLKYLLNTGLHYGVSTWSMRNYESTQYVDPGLKTPALLGDVTCCADINNCVSNIVHARNVYVVKATVSCFKRR
ncbi:hypothetical protein L3X38_001443 [Prunus dulcis]|uniref:Uncharacterized protein n=1 Tax=Prunus dulcis TaxID=3755 RepID=A0AAD4WUF4_PRUDU|nr:hypothetical protein L3X38_001443 [Prunus dulcis]